MLLIICIVNFFSRFIKPQAWLAFRCLRDMQNSTARRNLNGTTGAHSFFLSFCCSFSFPFSYILILLCLLALLSRGFSTFHAFFVALASSYILLVSDLFKDTSEDVPMTFRTSTLSDTTLGVGYWNINYYWNIVGHLTLVFSITVKDMI